MLTLQEMLNAAAHRWTGLAARASAVTVSGVTSGFRPGWKVPDPAYNIHEGVQEIIFITHSDNQSGTTYLKDGSSYTRPYRTVFRFPLDPSTGQPFPDGIGMSIPTYVSCSCPAFRFYCEKEATSNQSSDIIFSNGGAYRTNDPTYICKHLVATAKKAITLRRKIGTQVSASTTKKEPDKVQPRRRDPMQPARNQPGSDSVNPETRKVSATSSSGIPQTWIGRLVYVLFNERSGR